MRNFLLTLFVTLSGLLSGSAFATAVTVNTSGAVEQLGEINTVIAAIGGALLVAAAIAVAFKWAKAAIFG